MREIKFRAWCEGAHGSTTFSKPHYEYDIYIHNGKYTNTETWEIYGDIETIPLEQFTGLRDKNDKEIYEGDIVRSSVLLSGEMINNTVRWIDCGFIANGLLGKRESEKCEVIGNIHENKDLLEGGN